MTLALLAALLLPALQDPQVDYREGLFEEVDQGNLDKAMERYTAILKGGAPDALKAKALLRTGFCLEKKGKKKEAEQAWRDVIERFPNAAETVKQARERLASMTATGGMSASQESQIQALVLDLTSGKFEQQNDAVAKLVALGQPAVPELRRALQSRSNTLVGTAAYVLVQIGATEGVYEGLRPLWFEQFAMGDWAVYALGQTLKASEEDRKKFLKDLKPVISRLLVPKLTAILTSIPDPAFPKLVEDWLYETEGNNDFYWSLWSASRDIAEIRRFAKRLASAPEFPHEKVRDLLRCRIARGKGGRLATPKPEGDPELKESLLAALAGDMESTRFLQSVTANSQDGHIILAPWLFAYVTPRELVQGPVHTWILKAPEPVRANVHEALSSSMDPQQTPHPDLPSVIRDYQLDFITSSQLPKDIRRLVYSYTKFPDKPELQSKFLQFSMELFREAAAKQDGDYDSARTTVNWLMKYLPENSKDLTEVMNVAAHRAWLSDEALNERPAIRAAVIRAAFGALKDETLNEELVGHPLSFIENFAKPSEKTALAEVLPGFKKNWPISEAIRVLVDAIEALPEEEKEGAWSTYCSSVEAAPPHVKAEMAQTIVEREGKPFDDLWIRLVDSADANVRNVALSHWGRPSQVLGDKRIPILVKALKDSQEQNQLTAIEGLLLHPDLNAVPPIIECLNSPFVNVRNLAAKALDEIKKHYEAQAEWKRWYDQTKKALGK